MLSYILILPTGDIFHLPAYTLCDVQITTTDHNLPSRLFEGEQFSASSQYINTSYYANVQTNLKVLEKIFCFLRFQEIV